MKLSNSDFDDSLVADFLESRVDEEMLIELYEKYKLDFDLLGYDFKIFLKEFQEKINKN